MLMSVIDASESVGHGQCSQLALGLCAVLSRRKLGGCALLILRQPTSDAGGHTAIIIVNHLDQSPPPTAHHPHCPLPLLQAVPVPAAPRLVGGVRRATDTLVARLRSSFGLDVLAACLFVKSRQSVPRVWGQRRTGAADMQVCSQQPHRLVHSSSVIYHHATQGDTAREQTAHITPDYVVYHKQTQRQALGMQLRNEGMRDTGTA